MSLGERLRMIRENLTQADFAAKIGVSQPTIRNYELEKRKPDSDFLNSICYNFNISPEWLLMGTGPMRESDRLEVPELKPAQLATRRQFNDNEKSQHAIFSGQKTQQTGDTSPLFDIQLELSTSYKANAALQRELTDSIRENADLRVALEQHKAHIRDLERENATLRKAMKPARLPGMDGQGVA